MGIIPQRGSEALIVASLLVERATVVEITGHDIPSTGSKRVLGLNLELRVTELRNPRTEAAKPQTHTPLLGVRVACKCTSKRSTATHWPETPELQAETFNPLSPKTLTQKAKLHASPPLHRRPTLRAARAGTTRGR